MPVISFKGTDGSMIVADLEYVEPEQEAALMAAAATAARPSLARGIVQLRQREAIWQAQATAAQQRIGWGDHFAVRVHPGMDPVFRPSPMMPSLTVYGTVPTREQFRAAEQDAAVVLGPDAAEVERTTGSADRAYKRGWRQVRVYSVIDPDGDLGAYHVAVMIPLTGAQFRAARAAGWPDEIPD
jgi:hypothetical protein